jgi:hypothetical protein
MDTSALLAAVTDQASFLAHVRALKTEREQGVPSLRAEWQNDTIESFLGAAIAWAEDSRFGAAQGLRDENLWKKFAVFLNCGKIYE